MKIQELERLQNKALRYIFWREYYHGGLSTSEIYRKYKILKISGLVKYERIMTIFRVRYCILRTPVTFTLNSQLNVRIEPLTAYGEYIF